MTAPAGPSAALTETLRWLSSMTATSSRDHAAHPFDAALYAVLVGWEGDDDPRHLDDLAARFGWRREYVEKLRAHRRTFAAGAVPDTGHRTAADLPARLRFAYSEAAHLGWHGVAATLLDLAGQLEPGDDDDSDEVCAAIARALASASPSGDTGREGGR